MTGQLVNDGLERVWKDTPMAGFNYHIIILFEALRKTTKKLSQDSRSTGLVLNSGPSGHEASSLAIRMRCLVT
jgi:hypothetical protein